MRYAKQRVLPLAAAGIIWTALAAVPASAQMVEKQSGSSGSSATSGSSGSRSTASRPTTSRSSSRSTASRSTSTRSRSTSSGTRARSAPRTPVETRGGRGYGEFRDSKDVQNIDRRRRNHPETYERRNRVDDRNHRRNHRPYRYYDRGRHHYYPRGYYGYYPYRYPYFSYYGAFGFWCPPFFDYGWHWERSRRGPARIYVDAYDDRRTGALDLDVSPEKAQIFIDGNLVGVADQYDGFPTYLWLDEGTYDVAIFKPGYETIFRQYTIYPGVVIDVEDRMQKGESIHPSEHVSKSTVNRDERIRRNREREEAVRRDTQAVQERPTSIERQEGAEPEIGRVVLDIIPPDAAVYLDGIFLGTGGEVTGLTSGLVVDPGEHLLEIIRPGYESREIEISVAEGERVDLAVELQQK